MPSVGREHADAINPAIAIESPSTEPPRKPRAAPACSYRDQDGDELSNPVGSEPRQDDSGDDEELESLSSYDSPLSIFEEPLQDRPVLDPSHPLSKVFGDLLNILHAELLSLTWGSTAAPVVGKRTRSSTTSPCANKRPRSPSEQWSEKETESKDEDTVLVYRKTVDSVSTRTSLACPFAVCFPEKNRSCYVHYELRDKRALDHHIWAAHRRPYYCPICLSTFAAGVLRDEHISRRTCAMQTEPECVINQFNSTDTPSQLDWKLAMHISVGLQLDEATLSWIEVGCL